VIALEQPTAGTTWERRRVRVRGVVQGVGFRPFVNRVATGLHVGGFVRNDTDGVLAEFEGESRVLDVLLGQLRDDAPRLAQVESIEWEPVAVTGTTAFHVVASRADAGGVTFVPPDAAVCDACLRELFDPHDRRYRYPFVNCTNCGPRFTITTALPYDRANTTMTGFALCEGCRREYEDPADRRFHAEPVACPVCGPRLRYADAHGATEESDDALAAAQRALLDGRIVAVKGIGGYHLACDAADDDAVARLRDRKRRPAKAFAVMVRSLSEAHGLAVLDELAVALLTSTARPIVLVPRRADAPINDGVAPGNPLVGVMLPYSPLHHLLLAPLPVGAPVPPAALVMTSGNVSDEPICHDDDDAFDRLGDIADAWLTHDRPIHVPCDDSVARVVGGVEQPVRRSRGHSPVPITLAHTAPPLLAVGGDLKNTFCLARSRTAWMSQHLGDMGSVETLRAFERSVAQFRAFYGIEPDVLVADLHPGYVTHEWAERHGPSVELVQHHHAHAVALMTEHAVAPDRAIIACTFDGTGYGTDGTVWGGEVLVSRYTDFGRATHLRTVAIPGGDAGVRSPARIALAHLRAAGIEWSEDLPPVRASSTDVLQVLDRQLERAVGCTPTSSAGRLFDAVSALLGVCQQASYEGQAAIELEAAAAAATGDGLRLGFGTGDDGMDPAPCLRDLVAGRRAGRSVPALAHAFHVALADALACAAESVRADTGIGVVGLTGGVFQNALLTTLARRALEARGFDVLVHRRVPPNDGGLALGQAAVAAARLGRTR
jgi:hydrogenase maturation protein HypF